MFGNATIAFAAAVGAGIFIYRKMAKRASQNDFVKTITPSIIVGILVFMFMLAFLSTLN